MEDNKNCPHCGKPVSNNNLGGVCPECMLKMGLGSGDRTRTVEAGSPPAPGRGFVPPEPATLAPHFPQLEILGLLGHGGMGAVYKARQKGLDRLVALKVLPPDAGGDPAFAERFTREARALARLSHPHIVTVYDFGHSGGFYYFLMELIDGPSLRQALRSGHLTSREALAIVPQICEALQYAHDAGVVHRDVKPENILLDRKGQVKIADFGLARLLGTETQAIRLTNSHDVMGTPHYMAPEQFEKPLEVDHRADIYSLGVVFYEMLTGELPLGRFEPPSHRVQMDVRLDEVVLRTLEKAPERRYQRASELKTRVETIAGAPAAAAAGVAATGTSPVTAFEYRSKQTCFGMPLVHIAFGFDPVTRKPLVARGVVAVGNIARGVIALGGVAMGGLAVGGASLGVISVGGAALGVLAMGGLGVGLVTLAGLSVGLVLAYGGLAIGAVAEGGLAIGYYAQGGLAIGAHTISAGVADPGAQRIFEALKSLKVLPHVLKGFPGLVVIFTLVFAFGFTLIQVLVRRQAGRGGGQTVPPPAGSAGI